MSYKERVCVLMGGLSEEREISLKTGESVFQTLKKGSYRPYKYVLDHPDEIIAVAERKAPVFNCLHGGIGEDGTLQSIFELLSVPYTGTGPLGSALSINKILSKGVFREESLDSPNYLAPENRYREDFLDLVSHEIGFPAVIKPVGKGSSIDVRMAKDKKELDKHFPTDEGFRSFFVEKYVEGRELTVGILEIDGELKVLPLIELRVKSEPFYNYRAKYKFGETEVLSPAPVKRGVAQKIENMARKAHKAFGCRGYSRADFILNEGEVYILELNTVPGMTENSNFPRAALEEGISREELVGHMLESAIERKDKIKTEGA